MAPQDTPIRRKLVRVIMLTSVSALILTCTAFIIYEFFSFRETARDQLFTLGEVTAANSTAALAFDNQEDADETLKALKAEKHLVAACLYDNDGHIFSTYPAQALVPDSLPAAPEESIYRFSQNHLEGFQPVVQGYKRLGTLYLKSDMLALYERLRQYSLIAFMVISVSSLLAYLLSQRLQQTISEPVLALAETARIISAQRDYSVRANKLGNDELGILTDAFNQMLAQIETQNAEILSFTHNLEQKVRERTLELEVAKEELEAVNDQLRKSNRDLEQFASVASHDLQEPLRKIRTFTDFVERNLEKPEVAHGYFDKIKSSAARMSDLIKSVLDYSRLSKKGEEIEPIDLNEIVENIKTDLELVISEKDAQIAHSHLPTVHGIPLQLNQLFLNLISNGLKFSDRKPQINISANWLSEKDAAGHENLATGQTYIELVFQDNGIGFEQKYADQIFTIFQRLHSKDAYAGTGIGLALCKKIVENHRGFISAKSEPGKGSCFYIYLPILSPENPPSETSGSPTNLGESI